MTDVPNTVPVFNGPIQNQAGVVGVAVTPLALAGFFSDIDTADTLTITLAPASTLPAGLSLSSAGTISGSATTTGTTSLTAIATDEAGSSVSSNTFTYTISAANLPPNITGRTPAGVLTLTEGDTETVEITVTDESLATLDFSVLSSDEDVVDVAEVADGEYLLSAVSQGSAAITIVVTDEEGETDSETVTVNVESVANAAPVIGARTPAAGTLTIEDGDSQSVAVTVSDEDPASLTFTASSDDTDVAVVVSDGGGNFTVTATGPGTATVVLAVEDNGGLTDTETFDVLVPAVAVNLAPVIGTRTPAAGVLTIEDGDSQSVAVAVADEDSDSLVFTASSGDTDVAVVVVDGGGDFTVTATGPGTATIVLAVEDNGGLADTESFDVLVPAPVVVNQPPEIVSRDPAIDPLTGLEVDDVDPVEFVLSDEDPDSLLLSAVSSDPSIVLIEDIDQEDAVVFLEGITSGTATITVTVTDAGGLTDQVEFDVFIAGPSNTAPVFNGSFDDQEFETGAAIAPLDISGEFVDNDGDSLVFSTTALPPGLSIDSDSGEISGTPTTAGSFDVSVSATDEDGSGTTTDATEPLSFEITDPVIVIVNSPPEVVATQSDLEVDVDIALVPIDVATLFDDDDNDVLTFEADDLPTGLALDPASGLIEGTPTVEETVVVTVTAVDAAGSNTPVDADSFSIEVVAQPVANLEPEFDGPIADIALVVDEDIATIEAAAFFSDPEGDTLEFSASGLPDGLLIDPDTGDIDGAPLSSGNFSAVVSVIDLLGSNTEVSSNVFDIEVEAAAVVNLAPIFNGPIDDLNLIVDVEIPSFDVSAFFTDPEDDVLTFFANQLPTGLELDADSGLIDGTPADLESVSVTIEALDADGSGESVSSNSVEIIVVAGDAS